MTSNNRKKYLRTAGFVLAATLSGACNKVPDYVIQPDEMAELMADIHTAESVTEMNFKEYETDSSKLALKQAVLERHGVDQAKLDTSFMWYGAHLDRYMRVYDKTIEVLEGRLEHSDALLAAEAGVSVAGDSVDVWTRPRIFAFSPLMGTNSMTFLISSDDNWEKGDRYTWRAKFFNLQKPAKWMVAAEYKTGEYEVLNSTITGDGWQEVTFSMDSNLVADKIYGVLTMPENNTRGNVYLDSMQLVRNRLNPTTYGQRYRQRLYRKRVPVKIKTEENDSVSVAQTEN